MSTPIALPGVYRPRSDTALLAGAIDELAREHGHQQRARWLDVCTGTGALALRAWAAGARDVTAVDRGRRAVLSARLNARRARTGIRVVRGDLLDAVRPRRFDVITANPPYLPSPEPAAAPPRGAARAWDAGPDGRLVLDRLCRDLPAALAPGGTALIVQSSLAGVDRTVGDLTAAGLDAEVVATARGPLGPIAAARADRLRALGLLPADAQEELVVVRARATQGRA